MASNEDKLLRSNVDLDMFSPTPNTKTISTSTTLKDSHPRTSPESPTLSTNELGFGKEERTNIAAELKDDTEQEAKKSTEAVEFGEDSDSKAEELTPTGNEPESPAPGSSFFPSSSSSSSSSSSPAVGSSSSGSELASPVSTSGDVLVPSFNLVGTSVGAPLSRVIVKYSSLSQEGFSPQLKTKPNQDAHTEILNYGNSDEKAFFGVFDGHGPHGHVVSQFVSNRLPNLFLEQDDVDETNQQSVMEALNDAFVNTNRELVADPEIKDAQSGSTGFVCLILGRILYSANVGDSRGVLAQQCGDQYYALPLSFDHKPDRPDEKRRIVASGGRVHPRKGLAGDIGPPRVWLGEYDAPGLAVSRSFGDSLASSVGVIAEPEIWIRRIREYDAFVILASDGVWEFLTAQEAVDIVAAAASPEEGCAALVKAATEEWAKEEPSRDDITVTVVCFR